MKKVKRLLAIMILLSVLSSCYNVPLNSITPSQMTTETATTLPTETNEIPSPTTSPLVSPSPSPSPTVEPEPENIKLDFLNDKFDKVEVFVDGNYMDVSHIWESFKQVMGKPVFRYFNELDTLNKKDHIRFTKDGMEFSLSALERTNFTPYRGSDYGTLSSVGGGEPYSSYYIPNISLFYDMFYLGSHQEDDERGLVLQEYFSGDVFMMMYDSVALKYDDSYIWTPKKTIPIYNIAKYLESYMDKEPDNIALYTNVRNYTYIHSIKAHISLDIYGKGLPDKGVYANVRYGDKDIWMLLDCSIDDFDEELRLDDTYNVPSDVQPERDYEWFKGFEKIELVYGDILVDVTEYWYKEPFCMKICDWETYLSGPALLVQYEYRMAKNDTVMTMGFSDTYDYFVSEGEGLYYCDFLTTYKNAFIMTEQEAVIESFLNRTPYQKIFQCAVLDILQGNMDDRTILKDQTIKFFAESIALKIEEQLGGKPDIELTKRSESTCYYKGEAISVVAWDIPDDGFNIGYVNIISDDSDIWLRIQNIGLLLNFLGLDYW